MSLEDLKQMNCMTITLPRLRSAVDQTGGAPAAGAARLPGLLCREPREDSAPAVHPVFGGHMISTTDIIPPKE